MSSSFSQDSGSESSNMTPNKEGLRSYKGGKPRKSRKFFPSMDKSRMIYMFKSRGKNKKQAKEEVQFGADGTGMGSFESVTSIISAITLPDSLAPVPEADPGNKWDSLQAEKDSKPRCPARRFSPAA